MPAAFPGAYGWGAAATGGRGGTLRVVSNLNASGAGSFKSAINAHNASGGASIIVFSVAGIIDAADLTVSAPDLTVAGQTAPGSGITLKNSSLQLESHNLIVRYLRSRGGNTTCMRLRSPNSPCHDVILDHISYSWNAAGGGAGNALGLNLIDLDEGDIYNITVQHCLFSQPMSNHPTGTLFRMQPGGVGTPGPDNLYQISYHHNLSSNVGHRNPHTRARNMEIFNNVLYNWRGWGMGFRATQDADTGNLGSQIDFINNYLKPGPYSVAEYFVRDNVGDTALCDIYVNGNIIEGVLTDPEADNWPSSEPVYVIELESGDTPVSQDHRRNDPLAGPTAYPLAPTSAAIAYEDVTVNVGANARLDSNGEFIYNLDSHDIAMIDDCLNDTGDTDLLSSPGTYPTQDAGTAYTDTDGDGMADDYEDLYGLDKNDNSDQNGTAAGNGWTNIENFINGIPITGYPNPTAPIIIRRIRG